MSPTSSARVEHDDPIAAADWTQQVLLGTCAASVAGRGRREQTHGLLRALGRQR